MKKLFISTLCIIVFLMGCTKNNKSDNVTNTNISNTATQTNDNKNTQDEKSVPSSNNARSTEKVTKDIYTFQIKINDDIYTFPMSYESFSEKGWSYDLKAISSSYSPNQTSSSIKFVHNQYKLSADCCLGNLLTDVVPWADCYIYEFSIDSADVSDTSAKITLSGDIEFGKSKLSDIKAVYGEPSSINEIEDFSILKYHLEYFREIELTIDKKTELLKGIRLINFNKQENIEEKNISADVPAIVKKYTAPKELGDDLDSFVVEYAGNLYQLPVPVSELLKNGWTIKEKTSDSKVAAGNTGYIELRKDNQTLDGTVTNFSTEAATIENCFLNNVIGWNASTNLPIKIQKGITRDMSEKDLRKALSDIDFKESVSSNLKTYSIQNTKSSLDGIHIYVDTNTKKVSGIEISNSELSYN
ncbi:hypothetical protein [Anaerosacchariphilus polymeriproducens]|uniref:Lipoprotein n=1 Tax=Anaerosacchariphilus polymeriproducens TaxID=1812858 RepID=A0A371AXP2_9FIRM|nr:hypothetical protein [Anaerosacchariphilus polymeriproducens]RDU24345.1 hypothetical protein DWV06_05055 [Anaerosacchariphilus polymeriproducens]